MPSPHPRVGLVVDEAMDRTLTRLAERRTDHAARAGVARWAIFKGAILEAYLDQLALADVRGVPVDARAALEAAIAAVDLPQDALDEVRAQLDHASLVQERAARRRRQLALLDTGEVPPGPTAQDVIEDIETADDPFA